MPIYEYRCANCGEVSEFIQKVSDPLQTTCPHCQTDALAKIVSSTSFQLKGSGWYATDFRNPSKPKTPETKPSSESKPEEKKTPPPSTDSGDKNK